MIVTTTVSGVVVGIDSQQLTLLLQSGRKAHAKYVETDLELGDKVLVSFNADTGAVTTVYSQNDIVRKGIAEVIPKETHPLLGIDSEYDYFEEYHK